MTESPGRLPLTHHLLTTPTQWEHPSLPLPLALDYFTRRGAQVVRVHWRVFGANGHETNPTCAVLARFVRVSPCLMACLA